MARHIRVKRRKDGCAVIRINGRTIVVPPVSTPTPGEKKLKRLILGDVTLKDDLDFLLGNGLDEWRLLMFLTMAARASIAANAFGNRYVFRLPSMRESKASVERLQNVANWVQKWFNRSPLPRDSVGCFIEMQKLPDTLASSAKYLDMCIERMRSANRFRDDPAALERTALMQLADYVHSATGSYCQTRVTRLLNAARKIAGKRPVTERAFLVRRLRERARSTAPKKL